MGRREGGVSKMVGGGGMQKPGIARPLAVRFLLVYGFGEGAAL